MWPPKPEVGGSNLAGRSSIDLQVKKVQGRPSAGISSRGPVLRAKKPRPPLRFLLKLSDSRSREGVAFCFLSASYDGGNVAFYGVSAKGFASGRIVEDASCRSIFQNNAYMGLVLGMLGKLLSIFLRACRSFCPVSGMPRIEYQVLISASLIWVYGYSLSWPGMLCFFIGMLIFVLVFSLSINFIHHCIYFRPDKYWREEQIDPRIIELHDQMEKQDNNKRAICVFIITFFVSFMFGPVARHLCLSL